MPDDRGHCGSLDYRDCIDINDRHEVRNWCMSLKVTPDQLKDAVRKVGTSADLVRQYLRGTLTPIGRAPRPLARVSSGGQ